MNSKDTWWFSIRLGYALLYSRRKLSSFDFWKVSGGLWISFSNCFTFSQYHRKVRTPHAKAGLCFLGKHYKKLKEQKSRVWAARSSDSVNWGWLCSEDHQIQGGGQMAFIGSLSIFVYSSLCSSSLSLFTLQTTLRTVLKVLLVRCACCCFFFSLKMNKVSSFNIIRSIKLV